MLSWSYPEDEEPGAVRTRPSPEKAAAASEDEENAGEQVKVTVAQAKGSSSTSSTPRTTGTSPTTTQLPPPSQGTSMKGLSTRGYIVSVVLVLTLGALVGVLATISHHLHRRLLPHQPASASHHHRHHHHRHHHHHHYHWEDLPAAQQRRLLLREHRYLTGRPMLSVSPGMDVGSGGGLGGDPNADGAVGSSGRIRDREAAAERDRAIIAASVRRDFALDLPARVHLPEEHSYGRYRAFRLREPEQESEIYQKCIRPPPNKTVYDKESPPPYRSQSTLLDERIVRCHSAGSSLMTRGFRKFPSTQSSSTPVVVVPPKRPTQSSYSESSSNASNLSSSTVPSEAGESQHHHQQPTHQEQNV